VQDDGEYDENDVDGTDDDDDERKEYEAVLTKTFDSILKIHCTHSEPDFLIPWQKTHQTTSTSSGFVINIPNVGKRIMTNAHSVEYGSIIQIQKRGDDVKYEATIEAIANECDLAVLQVVGDSTDDEQQNGENSPFWEGLSALEFGPLPELQEEVEVLGYPTGGDAMSVTSGVVSRIEMQEYAQAGMHLLAIQIDAAINPGNSGGPVVNEHLQVVGVAFQALDSAENIGYVVPVNVVQHFLDNVRRNNGQYTGFCALGTSLSLLENPTFRKSLGMTNTKTQSGVMIKEMAPTSAAKDLLYPNDVIMEVDGIPVANDGKVPFRPGERVSLLCYLQTKFKGDYVHLKLWRNQKELELDVPVSISRRLVPAHWNNRPPPYFIVAGLVFTALSVPYLHAASAWDDYINDNISYLLIQPNQPLEHPTDQVVILAQVLAHRANLGYDQFADLHLQQVNGKKVKSLQHLQQLIQEDSDDEFVRMEFAPDGRVIVLERSMLDQVTHDVCEEHSIRERSVIYTDAEDGKSGDNISEVNEDVPKCVSETDPTMATAAAVTKSSDVR